MDLMRLLGLPITALEADPELGRHLTRPERIEHRTHVDAPAIGVGFVDHGDGVVDTINVRCDETEGPSAFRGDLPMGLATSMTRAEVRGVLGEPEAWGGGEVPWLPGWRPAWDMFPVAGEVVHVSYRDREPGLAQVTVMLRELAAMRPPA